MFESFDFKFNYSEKQNILYQPEYLLFILYDSYLSL